MARVTGHVFLVDRKAGPQWYAKYRLPSGEQLQQRLGPAHTGRGRCPAGHLTERTAKDALNAILADARRGTRHRHDEQAAAVTFQDAAAENLRFIADGRKRERSTVNDYRGVIDGYLVPEFGPRAIDAITPDDIDVYKERLIAEGACRTEPSCGTCPSSTGSSSAPGVPGSLRTIRPPPTT